MSLGMAFFVGIGLAALLAGHGRLFYARLAALSLPVLSLGAIAWLVCR